MGGFRSDGKLLEKLQEAAQLLHEGGHDSLSDDVEEAIERLRPVYGAPVQQSEVDRLRDGLQLIATDEHRLMNITARNTAQAILDGKPIR